MQHATTMLSLSALLLASACAQPVEREQTQFTSDAPAARAKEPPPFEMGDGEFDNDEGPELNPASDSAADSPVDASSDDDIDGAADDAGYASDSDSGEAGWLDDASAPDSNVEPTPQPPTKPEPQPAPQPQPVPEPQPAPQPQPVPEPAPTPPSGAVTECASATDCASVVCVPIGITACCRDDHTCGCTWAPGAYCL
jgi:hypothetical protein